MSDGAMMSEPALAWHTACLHSCSTVSSFKIFPLRTTPSCPCHLLSKRHNLQPKHTWFEYGSNATSVHTIASGNAVLIMDTARGTSPFGLYDSSPTYVSRQDVRLGIRKLSTHACAVIP
jgi:hypothetical protein